MEITPTIEPKTNITKRETMQKKRKISIKMNFTPTPLDQSNDDENIGHTLIHKTHYT